MSFSICQDGDWRVVDLYLDTGFENAFSDMIRITD